MKNKQSLVFIWLAAFAVILIYTTRLPAAQEQALEISDVEFKSEGEPVAGKLYRLKELARPARRSSLCPDAGGISPAWSGCTNPSRKRAMSSCPSVSGTFPQDTI